MSPDEDNFAEALDAILSEGHQSVEGESFSSPAPPREGNVAQIAEVGIMHDQIMNWLLLNPHLTQDHCARHFGVTRTWLSVIIRSNCFQARLKEKQDVLFSAAVGDITTNLTALADVGIQKLQEKMETTNDVKVIHELTKTALQHLGFGNAKNSQTVNAENVQQNFYVASSEDLVAARGRITGAGLVSSTSPVIARSDAALLPQSFSHNPPEGE